MTGVKYNGPVKFSTIMKDLLEITNHERKGSRHLRLTKAGEELRLYTHDPNKWHGLNFITRQEKHQRAYEFVKAALVEELGSPEQAKRVLRRVELSRYKAITVKEMGLINDFLVEDQTRAKALLPAKMNIVRNEAGSITADAEFSFPPRLNTQIRDRLIDLLKTGRSERSKQADLLVDPQFLRDSHRQSRRFTSGGLKLEFRHLMLKTGEAERPRVAYESLATVVRRAGDSDEVIRQKVWDLTRLMTQTALGDVSVTLAAIRHGVTGAKDSTEQTTFDYDEALIDGQSYINIAIVSDARLIRFTNMDKGEDLTLDDASSFQRIALKLRVKAADLGGTLKSDSLEVIETTIEARMVPGPEQPDS